MSKYKVGDKLKSKVFKITYTVVDISSNPIIRLKDDKGYIGDCTETYLDENMELISSSQNTPTNPIYFQKFQVGDRVKSLWSGETGVIDKFYQHHNRYNVKMDKGGEMEFHSADLDIVNQIYQFTVKNASNSSNNGSWSGSYSPSSDPFASTYGVYDPSESFISPFSPDPMDKYKPQCECGQSKTARDAQENHASFHSSYCPIYQKEFKK